MAATHKIKASRVSEVIEMTGPLGGGELTGARGAHPHSAAGDGVDGGRARAEGDQPSLG
jgi:hypothetical protein